MSTEKAPYLECSTAPGSRSIIEAAAGTGKTHNITRIVARLIMERDDVGIENMVVVTFTRAAAAELKTRISALLSNLSLALETGKDDELIALALPNPSGEARAALKKRLHRAQLNFDQAAIGTIHGFAMRVLSENGFGSRQKLGFTLNEDTKPLIGELAGDYFRALLLRSSPEVSSLLTSGDALDLNEGKIASYVAARMSAPELRLADCSEAELGIAPDDSGRIPAAEALEKAASLFSPGAKPSPESKRIFAAVTAVVCEDAYSVVSKKFRQLSEENNFLSQDDLIFRLRDALKGNREFREALKKKYKVGLIDEFQDTSTAQFEIFKSLFLENGDSTFIVVGDPRQAIYRFRNCDLSAYLNALKEMGKPEEETDKPEEETDKPGKNADLFEMNVNRRSGARYIEALNAIFAPAGTPGIFALKDLDMPTQQALPDSQVLWDACGNEVEHPIQVFCDRGEGEKRLGLYSILRRCAKDIAAMLKAGYLIPEEKDAGGNIVKRSRSLGPGDIAVLLNTSWENGLRLKKELLKEGVPAVMVKEGNVFDTPEAQELIRFLEGVLNPDDSPARLRALITPLGDLDFAKMQDENETAAGAARLQKLLDTWQKRSFGVMYALLCREFRLYDRLKTPEERRKLGKYNALADYLAEAEFSRKLTPNALFGELCLRAGNASNAGKEFPAPPENDRGAVIINTVFGSKGLSYPVVFLPDLFIGTGNKRSGSCRCHDDDGKDERIVPPMASGLADNLPEEIRKMYQQEKDEVIQEDLRKAYVAFTRARYFCRFYCGISQNKDWEPNPASKNPRKPSWPRNAATDWLFRRKPGTRLPENFGDLTELMKPGDLFTDELNFPAEIGTEDVFPRPAEKPADLPAEKPADLPAEEFRRPDRLSDLGFSRGFLSFSNLSNGDHGKKSSFSGENDDEDPSQGDEESKEFQQLRGGTAFGNAIHKLLEHVDFAADLEQLEEAAGKVLHDYGFGDEKMKKTVGEMVRNTLHSLLPDERTGGFRLCDIDPARKKSELKFLCEFDTAFKSSELFREVSDYFAPRAPVTAFPAANEIFERGFFNGSIDLFFEHDSRYFIVDWKTNLLKGENPYSKGALDAVMGKSGYCLQYLIYTAALFKFLKRRLKIADEESFYNERFGGVYYLFVRGMNRPGSGIFYDKPPYKTCDKMEGFIG